MKRILVILLLTISMAASATRYYVSSSGNNANNGLTTSTPWQTLQYAELHAVNAGDVIALKKGDVWLTNLALGIHHGGVSGNPIIWDGSLWGTGANATIRSSANRTGSNLSIVNITGCSYVTFQNIVVDGNNTFTFGLVIGGTNNMYSPGGVQNFEKGIVVQNSSILNCGNGITYTLGLLVQTWKTDISDITIKGNIFNGADDEQLAFYGGKTADGATPAECKNVYIGYNTLTNWGRRGQSTGYGLQINNKITNVVIEYNTLTTGANGYGNALHVESNETVPGYFPKGVIIRYNKIYATRDNTFCIYITQGQAKTVDVYYNLLYGSTKTATGGGIWVVNSGSPSWAGAKLNFYNNTIYTTSGRSFTNGADPGVVTLKNNLFYNNGTDDYGMMCLLNNTAGAATHSHNLYYRSANASYTKIKDGGAYAKTITQVLSWETTAKSSDPLFKSPGTDFHLQTGSPAIGAGVAISGLTKDIDGVSLTNPPDIGCYQSQPGFITAVIPPKTTIPSNVKMKLFPNPVNHVLNISFEYSSTYSVNDATKTPNRIRITDMSGKLVAEEILEAGIPQQQIILDLVSGVYVVLLVSNNLNISSQKLIVFN